MLSLYYFSWLRRRTPSYVMKADIKYCRYYCRSQDLIVLILVTGSLLLIKVSESGVFMSTIYFMTFITAVYERIRPFSHYATVKRFVSFAYPTRNLRVSSKIHSVLHTTRRIDDAFSISLADCTLLESCTSCSRSGGGTTLIIFFSGKLYMFV